MDKKTHTLDRSHALNLDFGKLLACNANKLLQEAIVTLYVT